MKNSANDVERLLHEMTLEEKIGQLNHPNAYGGNTTGAAEKVDIVERIRRGQVGGMSAGLDPAFTRRMQEIAINESPRGIPLLFTLDVIHGYRTIFPIPLGLSCSWDLELLRRTARVAATEASAAGVCVAWAPMLDITRDARWGRCAEGLGEDPYLASRIARVLVEGFQGTDLSAADTVMATAKHFAGYGLSEAGRDYNTVDVSPYRLHNTILPPFKAAIEAGAGAVMVGFSELGGIPLTAHEELLQRLLRDRWDFDGLLVTDYTAIMELVNHGVAKDLKEAALLAFKAGITIDLVSEAFVQHLGELFADGQVTEDEIDASCRRVLEAKYRLGLFADPYRYLDASRRPNVTLTDDNRRLAREAAAKCCVLLKNDGRILPLKKDGITIALVGPLADSRENMQGTWAVAANSQDSVTLLEGMRQVVGPGTAILHAKGANIVDDPNIAARLNVFGEIAVIDKRSPKDLIAEAVGVAKQASVIVACVGEAKEHSGESSTRTELGLPGGQRQLLEALHETGKPLVLVTMSGRPLTLEWETEHAAAILHGWFAGTEAGPGIADVLFGNQNPSGKLTMTFPRTVGQCPIYYAESATGRPIHKVGLDATDDCEVDGRGGRVFRKFTTACCLEGPHTPLFPFGFGLSYSTFDYGPIQLDKRSLCGETDCLTATVAVSNSSAVAGEETVQLYIKDPVASRSRPVRELKGFKKIALSPWETKDVVFRITVADLRFYRASGYSEAEHLWEPGEFVIQIGPNCEALQSASVTWNRAEEPMRPSAADKAAIQKRLGS